MIKIVEMGRVLEIRLSGFFWKYHRGQEKINFYVHRDPI